MEFLLGHLQTGIWLSLSCMLVRSLKFSSKNNNTFWHPSLQQPPFSHSLLCCLLFPCCLFFGLACLKVGDEYHYIPGKRRSVVCHNFPIIDEYQTQSELRFWPYHENWLIKTILMIPHSPYVSVKLTSLYCGLRIILVYPNPQ